MAGIIKRPLVSEKNSALAESGVYAFEVVREATKTEVKTAIEKSFKVKVVSVNTVVCRGRSKRTKTGYSTPTYWKKALVKLAAGEKIGLFEGA
jgi:large subunit ribosomal protein L23